MNDIPPRASIGSDAMDRLRQCAREAGARAYAPYSRFPVGAALMTRDGRLVGACNVENASFGLSMCAERAAVFAAVAQGLRDFVAVAVYTPTANVTPPCGACRQVLHEFAPGAVVVCCNGDAAAERQYHVADLLPEAFGSTNL
jgi:cytidine deaminase